MNVLWIVNIIFPEANTLLTGNKKASGGAGWMIGLADNLVKHNIELSIVSLSVTVSELKVLKGESITYYLIPFGKGNRKYNKDYEPFMREIRDKTKPDVVHIHGTEFTQGLSYVRACGKDHVVVSLQGIKTGIARHYLAGLTFRDVIRNMTFRDIIKGGLYTERKNFVNTGILEQELIRSLNHVIGRTEWDHAQVLSYNTNINYHFCNEILRSEFYDGSHWQYDKCTQHTIFLSQAWYPLKGAHQLLKALPLILRKYPDTQIRIAGTDITSYTGMYKIKHESTYGRYLRKLIQRLHIAQHIIFLGDLTSAQMKQEYLKTNVFVCPSSIENSPNSLGEAQILGVPHVSSYIGGTPDMMRGNEGNLYRFEEVEMLAEKICTIFANKDKQIDMTDVARKRHDPLTNGECIYAIYQLLSK